MIINFTNKLKLLITGSVLVCEVRFVTKTHAQQQHFMKRTNGRDFCHKNYGKQS